MKELTVMPNSTIDPKLLESLENMHSNTEVQWFGGTNPQPKPAQSVPIPPKTTVATPAKTKTAPKKQLSKEQKNTRYLLIPSLVVVFIIAVTVIAKIFKFAFISGPIETTIYTILALVELPCITIYTLLYMDAVQQEDSIGGQSEERANPWVPRLLLIGPLFILLVGLILLLFLGDNESTPNTIVSLSAFFVIIGPFCTVSLIVLLALFILRKMNMPFQLPDLLNAVVSYIRRWFR